MKKILLCMGLSALFAGCGGREKPLAEVVDEALARRGCFVGFALVVQRIFSGNVVVRV